MVRVRVLGALEAEVGGRVVDLGGPRQRGVLALLLVARGDVVSVDRLIEDLWRGEPPPRAIGALQAYVSNLRRILEPDRPPRAPAQVLVSVAPGYAVRLPGDAVDAWRFEAAVRATATPDATPDDPAATRRELESALAMWRGDAYAEVAAEPWAAAEAARLGELRQVARERLVEATIGAGAPADAIPDAEALTREHPLREEGWRLLASALYGAGRQADALAALRRARAVLAEELGLDPGPGLVELEAAVLAQRLPVPAPRLARDVRPAAAAGGTAAEPLPAPPPDDEFVGREAELDTLRATARDAAAGLRIALVTGEAGAGKSAVIDRFRQHLAAEGWRVPLGRCPEAEGAPPAWAWVEALRSLAAEVNPGSHAAGVAPLLERADAEPATGDAQDVAFARFRLHRAVSEWLAAATDRPLAITLDDLHRADDETLALLRSLADDLRGVPVLLLAAYRPSEADRLDDTLAALARHAPTRLRLEGLNADQAARLVQHVAGVRPDPATIAALADRTGGNPFYLRESARLLASEGALVATSEVPEGVRDVLRRRFARLPEVSISVLRLAAVMGRDVDIEVLIRAAEVDEDAVLDGLEAGVLAGLLAEPAPGAVRFGHALVRETLYGDLSRLRHGRWHARIAAALEALRPDDVTALAYHHGQSISSATARRAADAAVAAADLAESRYAHEAAADLYRQALAALDLLPESGSRSDDDERVELLCRLARVLINAGSTVPALEVRQEALARAERSGRDDLVLRTLTRWDVRTPWLTRSYASLDPHVVGHLERLLLRPDLAIGDRTRLLCTLAGEVSGTDDARTRSATSEALALARRAGDPVLLGLALSERALALLPDVEPDERLALAEELVAVGERHGLPSYVVLGLHCRLQDAAMRLALDDVRDLRARLAELADRYQFRQAQVTLRMTDGFLACAVGRLEDAEREYASVGHTMRRMAAVDADGVAGLGILLVRLTQGRIGEMEPMLRGLHGIYGDVVADVLALSLASLGRLDEARAVHRRSPAQPRHDFLKLLFLAIRGLTVAVLGEREEAQAAYDSLLPYADRIAGASTAVYVLCPVGQVLGDLAALLDRPGDAARHYTAALGMATACGSAPWQAAARKGLESLGQAIDQRIDQRIASGPQADH